MQLLNRLSTEILIYILASANSLSDLLALASTSQRIYSVFHSDRVALIYHAFANELGPEVLADALALSHIKVMPRKLHMEAFRHQFGGLVSTYGRHLAGHHHVSPRLLSMDHVLRLVRSYRAVALVTNAYITCALKLFQREVRPFCPGPDSATTSLIAPPSRSEWLRVLRAHYRLHIVLSFWATRAYRGWVHFNEIRRPLFALWEPWEVQQVFCAGTFYTRFRRLLSAVYYRDKYQPRGRHERYTVYWFDEVRKLAVQVRATDEKAWQETQDQVSTFLPGPTFPPELTILPGLEAAGADEEKGLEWFQQRLWDNREPGLHERSRLPVSLCFDGDCVNTVPFGWVDAFDGRYEYDFLRVQAGIRREGQLPRGLWSRTGFVMWDASRVEAFKTSSYLSPAATGWARAPPSSQ